jgi:hypothetical protein
MNRCSLFRQARDILQQALKKTGFSALLTDLLLCNTFIYRLELVVLSWIAKVIVVACLKEQYLNFMQGKY